jgi:hypothetical protein
MSVLDNPSNLAETPASPWSIAMRFGGLTALVLIVLGLIGYLGGFTDPSNGTSTMSILFSVLTFATWIGGVIMAVRAYKASLGGFISFGTAFKTSFFTILVISAITAVWSFLFYSFIATDFLEVVLEFMRTTMEGQGLDDDAIDMAMGMYEIVYTPVGMVGASLISGLIGGAIVSLIVGAAMKKDRPLT